MAYDLWGDPESAGILGMASGLMGAAGPSRMPVSLGQAMGAGLQRGLLDRTRAEELATQKMLREAQAEKMRQELAQREYLKTLFQQITDPQERLFAQLNPEAWVKSKLDRAADPKPFGAPEAGYHILENGQPRQLVPPVAKKEKPTSDEALLIAAGYTPGTPEYQAAARELLKKKSEFAPSQNNITLTAPQMVMDPQNGQWSMVQGANRPGAAPQVTPLPGGAVPAGYADDLTKQREKQSKARMNVTHAQTKAETVISKVDEALNKVGPITTGIVGSVTGRVPGTEAYDLRGAIDTVKANIGFQELSDMRAASPTGGALGQVAVQELNFLQAAVASLDPNQSPDTVRANLNKVRNHFERWKNAVKQSYQETYPDSDVPAPVAPVSAGGGKRKKYNPATGRIE